MDHKEGLEEIWPEIQKTLIDIIPIYEKGNNIISFGQDKKLRHQGIIETVKTGDAVLDLGSGPGTMSRVLLDNIENIGNLVLMDPLRPMLNIAKMNLNDNPSKNISGIFEKLPFKDNMFDVVMCGYSFRDAQNFKIAAKEMKRVLKNEGGRLLIVDIGKPDNRFLRWFIGLYFRFFAGLLAALFLGRKGFMFSKIYPTYRKFLTINQLRNVFQNLFDDVKIETSMLGGAIKVVAQDLKNPKAMHD